MKHLIFILIMTLTSCHWINTKLGMQDDNAGEELIEEVIDTAIQYEIGVKPNIDLTPATPEKH